MKEQINCQYCKTPAKLVSGKNIYPGRKDLWSRCFWKCETCGAYVGTRRDRTPLGTLANHELRRLRSKAHSLFDPLWKDTHHSRTKVYKWLAKGLGISYKDCHMALFDENTCKKVIKICENMCFFT